MIDWSAIMETDARIRENSNRVEDMLGEAHELGLLPIGISMADAKRDGRQKR